MFVDSYQGCIYDPVSLHKYLYANANPAMYTDSSGYFGVFVVGMGAMTSSEIQEAQNEAIMFNIGMNLLNKLWAIKEVQAISYVATDILLAIELNDILDDTDFDIAVKIAVEMLEDVLDDIELICQKAGINSNSISAKIKTALYEEKSKGKNPEKKLMKMLNELEREKNQ